MRHTETFHDIEALFDDETEREDVSLPNEWVSPEECLSKSDSFEDMSDEEDASEIEELPEMNEEDILEARRASVTKFTSTLHSICERYNRPFEDGDEIDIMSLQLIVDRGYLRSASHQSVFGKGVDGQLVDMIERRQVTCWIERCKRCRIRIDHEENVYCQKCKQELRERRSFVSFSSPIKSQAVSYESHPSTSPSSPWLSGK
jgi:hypothetical protein